MGHIDTVPGQGLPASSSNYTDLFEAPHDRIQKNSRLLNVSKLLHQTFAPKPFALPVDNVSALDQVVPQLLESSDDDSDDSTFEDDDNSDDSSFEGVLLSCQRGRQAF